MNDTTTPEHTTRRAFRVFAIIWVGLAWSIFLIWPLGLAGLVAVEVAFAAIFLAQVWRRRRWRHVVTLLALPALFITQMTVWATLSNHVGGQDTPRALPWSSLDTGRASPFLQDGETRDRFEHFNADRDSRLRIHQPFCSRDTGRLLKAHRRWSSAVSELSRSALLRLVGPPKGAYTGPYPDREAAYTLINSERARQGTISGLFRGVETQQGCLRLHADARRELHSQAPADLDYIVGRGHHRAPLPGDCAAPHWLDGPSDRPITYALLGDEGIVVQLGLLPHESPVYLDPPLFLLDLENSQLFAFYTHR